MSFAARDTELDADGRFPRMTNFDETQAFRMGKDAVELLRAESMADCEAGESKLSTRLRGKHGAVPDLADKSSTGISSK